MTNNTIWNDTEQSLAILMQQGNQQAFGKLYDRYAPMLMGLIIRLVDGKETAEDVLQQVFKKIWDNKAVFDFSRDRLFCKMLKIARDTANETGSTQKTDFNRNRQIPDTGETVYIYGSQNPIPEQPDNINFGIQFDMDRTSKEALDLIYFKGYNFDDAAAVLDLPSDILKEKVKIAIEHLKVVTCS
jgi:DNA-directed RNA polymerase specialized sigma24 family protein